ncbi:MAG TPA: hypothetical protein VH593_18905, partial [Ktedonobacteraceae bacterium]
MVRQKQLFRDQALQHYAQSREKTILPRTVAPPVFFCCWLLLTLLLVSILLAWQVSVPIFMGAAGVLFHQPPDQQAATNEWEAILFVRADPNSTLQVGDALMLQVALTGEHFTGKIERIVPGVVTPEEARQRYALTGDLALVITQPSIVVQVAVDPPLPA